MDNYSNKPILLIYKTNDLKLVENHLKKFKKIIVFDNQYSYLSSENLPCKVASDYLNSSLFKKVRNDARLWVQKWPRKKISDKSFNEIFNFKNIPLWYFAENSMYKSVEEFIKEYTIIEQIIKKEDPDKIYVLGNSPVIRNLEFINEFEINYIDLKSPSQIEKNLFRDNPKLLWFLTRIYDPFKNIVVKIFFGKKIRKKSINNPILMYSHNLNWRSNFDPKLNQKIESDSFFGSIIKELEQNDCEYITTFPLGYLTLNFLNSFFSGLEASEKRNKSGLKHIPFEYYWNIFIDKKASLERKKFISTWKKLKFDENFISSFKYKRLDLWPLLEKDLNFFFEFTVGHSIKNIEIALNMIDDLKPSLLISAGGGDFHCEFSLIKAFALKKISSLEIQHGIISYDNPTYITPKDDEFFNIAVYGPFYKELLVNYGGYSQSRVFITGQARYDILSESKIGKKRICEMLDIDFNKKLILWTTQTHGLFRDEAIETKSAIYKAFKSLENVQLIIKLHPGETDLNFYQDDSFQPILVREEIDAFELAYACDLMITKNSTTALEAIAMNKPVLVFNLSGEPDFVNYVEESVAVGVYTEKKLKNSIINLLEDDSNLAENRKIFIKNYLYKTDGKSTKRIIRLINQIKKKV